MADLFEREFEETFRAHAGRLTRVLDRVSGDPDLAADLVQEAFVRLYRRRSMPEAPGAWLVSVALNLLRNARTTTKRRGELLALQAASDGDAHSSDASRVEDDRSHRVRRAMAGLDERDRQLLMLRAEGYRYREIALALQLNEGSVGTLLARAKDAFRKHYEDGPSAS